jgi:hypothetical protein
MTNEATVKPDSIETIITDVKRIKQSWVDGDYPLPEVLESMVERDHMRFRIYPNPDKFDEDTNATDHILRLTARAINGFRANRCVLISDSYMQSFPDAVDDYKLITARYKYGSLGEAFAAGKAKELGISETMMAIVVNRVPGEEITNSTHISIPYATERKSIKWDETLTSEMPGPITEEEHGRVPWVLASAFEMEDLVAEVQSTLGGINEGFDTYLNSESARILADVHVILKLVDIGAFVFVESDDQRIADHYKQKCNEYGITVLPRRSRAERRRATRHRN